MPFDFDRPGVGEYDELPVRERYQNEIGGESIGFDLTRATVEELAGVCRRLLDSAHTSEPAAG